MSPKKTAKEKQQQETKPEKAEKPHYTKEEKIQRHKEDQLERTLFVQNLSYDTTEEQLKECMNNYGDVSYCKICIDKSSGLSRGSGFVCYRRRGVCEKILEEQYMFSAPGNKESNIELNGRRLILQHALSKDTAAEKRKARKLEKTEIKDMRNIGLATVGQKTKEEYELMGLKPEEIKMRLKAQMERNKKLKNVNFAINKYRICVRNIPKTANKGALKKVFEPYWFVS